MRKESMTTLLASDSLSTEDRGQVSKLWKQNTGKKSAAKQFDFFFFTNETDDKVTLQELVINPLHTYLTVYSEQDQ